MHAIEPISLLQQPVGLDLDRFALEIKPSSADPELIDEQRKARVKLIVPYPGGSDDQVLGVVERNPWRLVDDLPVDPGP
jgi:hypothetical protein